jgi:transcriptional regulator with XRE-family HTH domain
MTNHWSERLIASMREKGWTAAELARRSGVDVQKIYKYMRGKVDAPRGKTLALLSKALGVNELWLVYGAEDHNAPTAGSSQVIELGRIPIVNLVDLSRLKSIADLPKMLKDRKELTVPDDVGPRAVAVRLDDDSMAPKFAQGSVVICDPDAPIVPGRYVIALSTSANRAVFRRFKATSANNQKGELIAENPNFPALKIGTEKDGFIVGRAVTIFQVL